jgi:Zn-dependent protease with chaperone function
MRVYGCATILYLFSLAAAGCSATSSTQLTNSGPTSLLDHSRQARVESALAAVRPATGLPAIALHITTSTEPTAFSWSSGCIYISRGLVDLVDDNELSAVLAHEFGHLLKAPASHRKLGAAVSSLHGATSSIETECRADAVGVELLRNAGVPARSMATMLEKVRLATHRTPSCNSDLSRRVELLRSANN